MFDPICNRCLCTITASRTKPKTEIRTHLIYLQTGIIQFIRKLIVETPERRIVIDPTIIYNIRIQWFYTILCKALFYLCKTLQNILCSNILHIVIPRIKLLTEFCFCCNCFDIFIEVILTYKVVCTTCGTNDRIPCCHLTRYFFFIICELILCIIQRLTIPISYKRQLVLCIDLILCLREFTTPIHSTYIVRLSKFKIVTLHTSHLCIIFLLRDRPVCFLCQSFIRQYDMFQINMINDCFTWLICCDIQVLSHEAVSSLHCKHFTDRIRNTT